MSREQSATKAIKKQQEKVRVLTECVAVGHSEIWGLKHQMTLISQEAAETKQELILVRQEVIVLKQTLTQIHQLINQIPPL